MQKTKTVPAQTSDATIMRRDIGIEPPSPARKKSRSNRSFWYKQFYTWHWISAAVSLAGMLLFAITGITLNHADIIGAEPQTTSYEGQLSPALVRELDKPHAENALLPASVAVALHKTIPIDTAKFPADWSADDEVYVSMDGPGRTAWASIDRSTGVITGEITRRGWVSYINDLHKGRNTGAAWSWFIDIFAGFCIVFTLSGLLLLKIHSKHRRMTWPMASLSIIIPVLIAALFIH